MTDQRPDELIDAYLAGELPPEQAAEVRAYLDAHPGRRGVVAGFLATARGEDLGQIPPADVSRERLFARLDRECQPRTGISAAPLSGALSGGRPRTRLSGGIMRRTFGGWTGAGAMLGVAAAFVGAAWFSSHPGLHTNDRASHRTYITRAGERANVTLRDGTRITLAPQTTLTVAGDFDGEHREVRLVGAASFDVQHTVGAPFTVHAGRSVTRVLGTSFAIRYYAGDTAAQVSVTTGKVGVRLANSTSRELVLVAGRAATALDSGVIGTPRERTDVTAWVEGRLRFVDIPLRDVAIELSRAYGVTILVDSTLASDRVTVGAVVGVTPLSSVLDAIAPVVGAHYRVVTDGGRRIVTISPGPRPRVRARTVSPFVSEISHGR